MVTITKKDIVLTIIILILAFGGVPFGLYSVSVIRSRLAQSTIIPVVQTWMQENRAEAMETGKELRTAMEQFYTSTSTDQRWEIKTYNLYTRSYERTPYATALERLNKFCGKANDDIIKRQIKYALDPYGGSYYGSQNCSFILERQNSKIEAGYYALYEFKDPVDWGYIRSLTDLPLSSSSSVPLSIHKDGRGFHIFSLLSKQPLIVLEWRLYPTEDRAY